MAVQAALGPLTGSFARHLVMSPLAFMQRLAAAASSSSLRLILRRPVIERVLIQLALGPQPPPKSQTREVGHS